ncbi:MAG: hypothetical protein ABSG43_13285 [Solirubrobacteraceae bacterium]|jgi:hypothetical protein
MLAAVPTPFHQQAEEIGNYIFEDRARLAKRDRLAKRNRRETSPQDGPSENTD